MKSVFILLLVLLCAYAHAAVTLFPQPWRGNGDNLREMISHPESWTQTRNMTDMLGYWPWLMHIYHSPQEQKDFFACVEKWNKKLNLEVPVVKGNNWCGTLKGMNGTQAYAFYLELEKEFKANGMKQVDCFSFDEPIYSSVHVIPSQVGAGELKISNYRLSDDLYKRMEYGVRETAVYIKRIRTHSPGAQIVDTEPYPVLSADMLKRAVRDINNQCRVFGTKGIDSLRVDMDWFAMEAGIYKGSWIEIKELAEYCRSMGVKFSLIIWAADKPHLDGRSVDFNLQWYSGIMHMGGILKMMGLKPDEYVIESWIHMPNSFGPETDVNTYCGAARDFINNFVLK